MIKLKMKIMMLMISMIMIMMKMSKACNMGGNVVHIGIYCDNLKIRYFSKNDVKSLISEKF